MKRFLKISGVAFLSFALAIGVASIGVLPAQAQNGAISTIDPTVHLAALTFTATSQTKALSLPSSSCAAVSVTATSLTTATFTVKVSNDVGTTYYAAAVAPYVGSATRASVLTAITITTAPQLYLLNVAGMDHIEIVTSGTFTATNIVANITATGNPCPGGV